MAATSYSGPLSVVPTNEQLLAENRTDVKYDNSKTERLVRMCTDGRSDGLTNLQTCLNRLSSSS